MDKYEELFLKISDEVPIVETSLTGYNLYGFYYNNIIYIEETLSLVDKYETLLEEYGHYRTSSGVILDLKERANRQQESLAFSHSLGTRVTIEDFLECYEKGMKYYWEVAEYLGLSSEFLYNLVQEVKRRHGLIIEYKNYVIKFITESALLVTQK
ncbi:ImmA/IrrE family metallo-endopeptidase [Enterococcus sp. BWB1-3]|uniref:ImmA/IrrE family metallo-endopeptidase n=1 Tax=Enterococcus sp. BWB1-3 TaxID=2787713 RepID=UPI001920F2F0|nr:ImmA/IrrE family metallo-endopeptidase [Enterococcus sp. BWB1-3]MBL1228726.1 ImmA/IrrE family metallo-endopeptidase [Enterococcus sp. BWB1-3]